MLSLLVNAVALVVVVSIGLLAPVVLSPLFGVMAFVVARTMASELRHDDRYNRPL